jgi:hypothetical protein
MKKLGRWLLGAAIPLALALVGCGNMTGGTEVNTSAPTQTTGPVTIATDHSAYAPTDTMKVTIENHLTTAIYAYDTQASCSILRLEVQQNGKWVPSDALHCPLGRATRAVMIEPGGTYSATLGVRVMSIGQANTLPPGTYRLVLNYYSAPLSGASQAPAPTVVPSATLTISGSVPPGNNSIPSAPGAKPPQN